jgi:hypothetical protein
MGNSRFKRFDFREDDYIVAYLGCAGENAVARDLGRQNTSIKVRAKKLRDSGAWEAIERIRQAQQDYLACLGYDEVDQSLATLAR